MIRSMENGWILPLASILKNNKTSIISLPYYLRSQESWNEEQVDEILIEINIAQEKLEKLIRNDNNLLQNVVTSNTKIEPSEGKLKKILNYQKFNI